MTRRALTIFAFACIVDAFRHGCHMSKPTGMDQLLSTKGGCNERRLQTGISVCKTTSTVLFGVNPPSRKCDDQESPRVSLGLSTQISRRDLFKTCVVGVWAGTGLMAAAVHAFENTTESTKVKVSTAKPKLSPINLTQVAKSNQINVTLMCPPTPASYPPAGIDVSGCVMVDKRSFTKVKVPYNVPPWIPPFLRPKPKILKLIPNSELLEAAIFAGSLTEMMKTTLLYPLGTVKARVQAMEGRRRGRRRRLKIRRKKRLRLRQRLQVLGLNFERQFREGNLYAGLLPSLLISVPCTGVYYGVRDVTKRMLAITLQTPTKWDNIIVSVIGALVADVVSLIVRTPADVLAIRLQVRSVADGDETDENIAGDWFRDSIRRLPAAVLTDLPYLLSRIVLNGLIARGDEGIGRYELIYVVTAIVCAFLTTPFDVARTRILVDSNDDPTDGIDGGSGEGLIRTMRTVMNESEGGVRNLFRGWFERVVYLGIGRAWLEPSLILAYIGIRDAVLLQWFD